MVKHSRREAASLTMLTTQVLLGSDDFPGQEGKQQWVSLADMMAYFTSFSFLIAFVTISPVSVGAPHSAASSKPAEKETDMTGVMDVRSQPGETQSVALMPPIT